jgi:hypothetical protein
MRMVVLRTPADSNPHHLTLVRREVWNAFDALRAMPPEARQRFIDSHHYSNLSAEERELLNQLLERPPTSQGPLEVPPPSQ